MPEFLTESVTRAGHEELTTVDGISKSEFASYLEAAKYRLSIQKVGDSAAKLSGVFAFVEVVPLF